MVSRHSLSAQRGPRQPDTRGLRRSYRCSIRLLALGAVSLALQASLLDLADDVRLGALTGTVTRTPLAHGAWVDHRPGWVEGSDSVLDALVERHPVARRAPADVRPRRRRPAARRLVRRRPTTLPHPVLADARSALSAFYRPSSASRSPPPAAASTATAATRSPGTATPSAAARARTRWWRSCRSALPARCCCGPRTRRAEPRLPARPRRPARHGRLVPAHVGARRAQDGAARRPPREHPVPPRRRRLSRARSRRTPRAGHRDGDRPSGVRRASAQVHGGCVGLVVLGRGVLADRDHERGDDRCGDQEPGAHEERAGVALGQRGRKGSPARSRRWPPGRRWSQRLRPC